MFIVSVFSFCYLFNDQQDYTVALKSLALPATSAPLEYSCGHKAYDCRSSWYL